MKLKEQKVETFLLTSKIFCQLFASIPIRIAPLIFFAYAPFKGGVGVRQINPVTEYLRAG